MTSGSDRTDFTILGRSVRTFGATASLAAWLAHHWRFPHEEEPTSAFTITLRCSAELELPNDLARHVPATETRSNAALEPVYVNDAADHASVILGSREGGAYLELDADEATIHAWGVDQPGAAGRPALLTALHEAVRASGLLPLHCAAAVAPGEHGATAFLGPSGIGKSTTLITLVQQGWAPVCEDFAWLDPGDLRLYAWDRAVRMLPDAEGRVGPIAATPSTAPGETKRTIDYETLAARFGVRRRTSAPLQRLVRLQRHDGDSHWAPLSRVDAVPVAWEAVGLPLARPARRQVASRIGELVGRVERATLHAGSGAIVQDVDARASRGS